MRIVINRDSLDDYSTDADTIAALHLGLAVRVASNNGLLTGATIAFERLAREVAMNQPHMSVSEDMTGQQIIDLNRGLISDLLEDTLGSASPRKLYDLDLRAIIVAQRKYLTLPLSDNGCYAMPDTARSRELADWGSEI